MKTPAMPDRGLHPMSQRSHPYTPIRSSSNSTWSLSSVVSSPSTGSTAFWKTPPKKGLGWCPNRGYRHGIGAIRLFVSPYVVNFQEASRARVDSVCQYFQPRVVGLSTTVRRVIERSRKSWNHLLAIRFLLSLFCASFVLALLLRTPNHVRVAVQLNEIHASSGFQHVRAELLPSNHSRPDPIRWLMENSGDKHAISKNLFPQFTRLGMSGRPRAAIISLVRNSELQGMMQSMRQLEYRWNKKYQYPWIFFNNEPFTDEFKAGTRNLTSAPCYYQVVPKEHWSLPAWIDESRFMNSLEYLGTIGVGKGWMVSYHHMCRWNSGFFYKHPFLKDYDWYWRVEPDVHYFCDIDYDVFRFMQDNNLKYGFNMNILDDARSFPSLWTKTREFAAANPHLVHPEADTAWLMDNGEYNNCQFFSNFEIGSLNFWRGEANEAYFNWLDKAGGFYYERFGDAPVHTLSVAMLLPKSEVWFFRDIGYQHDINYHCPPRREGQCSCQPTSIDENFYKLVPLQSPQRKPADTCIREFLGGEWLKKREGWTMAGEKAFGGDGYHGYELLGDE